VSRLEKLEKIIGFSFSNETLLTQALTHRSFSIVNNERLEFLGDSILNFVIASALFEKFPKASEGELSRLRAGLVKRETLADVAREIDLGQYLTMGSGEMKSGGFDRSSILSDGLEAIFGAVIVDADAETASNCIRRLFDQRLAGLSADDLQKDAKSLLQEHLQGMGHPVPEYILLNSTGKSPNQEFEIECRSIQLENPVTAKGSSIRRAEQSAADLALQELGVPS
jgi:ribonuclease III